MLYTVRISIELRDESESDEIRERSERVERTLQTWDLKADAPSQLLERVIAAATELGRDISVPRPRIRRGR